MGLYAEEALILLRIVKRTRLIKEIEALHHAIFPHLTKEARTKRVRELQTQLSALGPPMPSAMDIASPEVKEKLKEMQRRLRKK